LLFIFTQLFLLRLVLLLDWDFPHLLLFWMIWRSSASLAFSMNKRSANLTRLSDLTQKLKQFGSSVKFNTCIIFNILVKPLLKIETAKLQAIWIIFSLDFYFKAIDQTSELKLSFEFCVYPPRHRFNTSSYIDFVTFSYFTVSNSNFFSKLFF